LAKKTKARFGHLPGNLSGFDGPLPGLSQDSTEYVAVMVNLHSCLWWTICSSPVVVW